MTMEAFDTRRVPLRFHMIHAADKSARQAFHKIRADGAGGKKASREMQIGTAAHAMTFGNCEVVRMPDKMKRDARTKAWTDFELEHAGAIIVTQGEYDTASFVADAIRANADARSLLEAGGARFEYTVYGERQGRATRKTPDVWHSNFIADLKTSEDVSPKGFPYKMRNFDVAGQLEWYAEPDQAVFIIAVEQDTCEVVVYELGTDSRRRGEARNQSRLNKILECEEKGVWPGYATEVIGIEQAEY